MVSKICSKCSKEFKVKAYRKDVAKFCSYECMRKERTVIICENCNVNFSVSPSYPKGQKFCSRRCMGENRRKITPKNILNCVECKKDFRVKPYQKEKTLFCSSDCRKSNEVKSRVTIECALCGKKIIVPPSWSGKKFCSRECKNSVKNVNLVCLFCGKETITKSYKNKYFCSEACSRANRTKISQETAEERKEKQQKSTKAWRNNNRELIRQARREYNQKPENKRKQLIYRNNNRQMYLASVKRYTQKNPDFVRRMKAVRRSRKKGASGSFTLAQWKSKIEYFGNCCYLCGESLENKITHLEHRIPLSRGGSNWIANIAPSCAKCNHSKHAKTEKEFREHRKLEKEILSN